MIERVDHVNIIVNDLEKMTAFYRDLLGMEVSRRAVISGQWIEALSGLENVKADVPYFELPEGPGVELIQYRTPKGDRPENLGTPNTRGIRHFALCFSEIHTLVTTLKKAGTKFWSEPQSVPDEQVKYITGKNLIYCHDPEGNLLELCSFGS